MHTVIRIIVPARTKQEALDAARTEFENICGEGKPFDYFTMFDEEGSAVSGRGRYGSIPSALKASTKAGKKMIADGMESTRLEFIDRMAKIRAGLARFTDDELFSGESTRVPKDIDLYLFRHNCYSAGQYSGPNLWLYDRHGSGIQTPRDLASALDSIDPLWVVPADVHF